MIAQLLRLIIRMFTTFQAQQAEILANQNLLLERMEEIKDILTPGPAVKIIFTANLDGTITEGATSMNLRDDQQVVLTIQPVDKKGAPALVDGVPVWASSDETVVTVTAAADGMSATAVGVAPGTGRVVVTVDADLGAGVSDLTGTLDFTVTGGGAVSLNIVAGEPTDQGAAPTPQA